MFNKILLAYDGSKDSKAALSVARNMASVFGSEISAICVLPDYEEFARHFSDINKDRFEKWVEKSLKAKSVKGLERVKQQLAKQGVRFEYGIQYGLPYKQILENAKKKEYGIIVLGRGRFGGESILGATAKKVLRHTNIPVLVIGRKASKSRKIKKILVPANIYTGMKKDLSYAQGIAGKFNSSIYLLNVVECGRHNYPAEIIQEMKGSAYNTLSTNIMELNTDVELEPRVRVAPSSWMGITEFIEKENIDLTVMMSYKGSKIRSEHFGSVAEKVVEHSMCPVMVLSP